MPDLESVTGIAAGAELSVALLNDRTQLALEIGKLKTKADNPVLLYTRGANTQVIAYEAGILDVYLPNIPKPKFNLLESVLWGVKLNGCAVSEREIKDILRLEFKT